MLCCERTRRCVVQKPISGNQLLLSPAKWCPPHLCPFVSWATQAVAELEVVAAVRDAELRATLAVGETSVIRLTIPLQSCQNTY